MIMARNLDEVREAFDDQEVAARFGRAFITRYASTAFGALPKSEVDLLVFSLLVDCGALDVNGPMYRIARSLNVTPAKARSLLFQHQLRHVSEEDTDHAVMMALTTGRFWKDGPNLAFGVTSPLVRAAIAAKMQERGVFTEVSLSGEILKVNPEQFGAVLSSLISAGQAERLLARLKKKVIDEAGLRHLIKTEGSKLAKEAVDTGASKGFEKLMEGLGDLFSGGAGEALDQVFN